MIVTKNQVFNLFNTNGRRKDILNAYKIYLEILSELKEKWDIYPISLSQFSFYQQAIERSKEVFKRHENYDALINDIGEDYGKFIARDQQWLNSNLSKINDKLDEAVELRARHYTSNLVKMGFTDEERNITPIGTAYMKSELNKDSIEKILPIDNINLILLRQMIKLRIYVKNENKYYFYSPFFMAILLLLKEENIAQETFELIIQGMNYDILSSEYENFLSGKTTIDQFIELVLNDTETNSEGIEIFANSEKIEKDVFSQYIKNRKSNSAVDTYYDFYLALMNFKAAQNDDTYLKLVDQVLNHKDSLEKAFGYGQSLFLNIGNDCSLAEFLQKNANNKFLTANNINSVFYEAYLKSKRLDTLKEYSDTTIRLLSATGIFKFSANPQIADKEIIARIFDSEMIKQNLFGQISENEFVIYEKEFINEISLSKILNISEEKTKDICDNIQYFLGVTTPIAASKKLKSKKSQDFINHIKAKYPKEKTIELLKLFSDRKNDVKIKKFVNDLATVPTIYEYVVAIAWFYIANEDFDIYESINLTLNADFEPVIHAGGGKGDIVIHYDSSIIMLEVTLMNKQAQKRGEWEPVLRHSLNLKAEFEEKDTITFFIADELDYNTINIWRAVSAVSLESTDTHKAVEGVVIMPFTNSNLIVFLEKDITQDSIIKETKQSFSSIPKISNLMWHENILKSLGT